MASETQKLWAVMNKLLETIKEEQARSRALHRRIVMQHLRHDDLRRRLRNLDRRLTKN